MNVKRSEAKLISRLFVFTLLLICGMIFAYFFSDYSIQNIFIALIQGFSTGLVTFLCLHITLSSRKDEIDQMKTHAVEPILTFSEVSEISSLNRMTHEELLRIAESFGCGDKVVIIGAQQGPLYRMTDEIECCYFTATINNKGHGECRNLIIYSSNIGDLDCDVSKEILFAYEGGDMAITSLSLSYDDIYANRFTETYVVDISASVRTIDLSKKAIQRRTYNG